MIVLVTGPVRSGKSMRAAHIARSLGSPVTYVATLRADPNDAEMRDRIARHRAERDAMPTIEVWRDGAPDLAQIVAAAAPHTTLLVDSLGTWLAGHLFALEAEVERDPIAAGALLDGFAEQLAGALPAAAAHCVFVSEEVGWGLVPASAQGRLFRDQLGRLAQRIARLADRVELVVAGLALDIKATGIPVVP